jgi:hypothetical protein
MTIEQTIAIPADRRLVIEVPETFTSGTVSLILFDAPQAKADKGRETIPPAPAEVEDAAWEAERVRKRNEAIAADPETQALLKRAADRAADPNRPKLSRLFGSHPGIFGGIDPVAYQRSIRDEWDD